MDGRHFLVVVALMVGVQATPRKDNSWLNELLEGEESDSDALFANSIPKRNKIIKHTRETPISVRATDPLELMPSSCREIRDNVANATSGEYSIRTARGLELYRVYCEMGLNGGGYTFLHPNDLPRISNSDVQAMFTDKTSFLMRVRKTDGTQPYGILQQLSNHQSVLLKLGLSDTVGYKQPVNLETLGSPYLYFGFLPVSTAQARTIQGLQVNGADLTFTNCDANPNSYIALFPNFAERTPSNYGSGWTFPFSDSLLSGSLKLNPSHRVIPDDYFMFLETHFGGCGCYTQTDGRLLTKSIISASIGFR